MRARVAIATAAAAVIDSGCSETSVEWTFGAIQARVGEPQVVAGWNVSVANLPRTVAG